MSPRTTGGFSSAVLAVGLCLSPALAGGEKPPERPSLDHVVTGWSPSLDGAKATKTGGVIQGRKGPKVAAHLFDVTGVSFEDVWNHYASKCGMKERFDKDTFRGKTWQGADGKPSAAVAERETRPGERVTVFTYWSAGHTVSVSVQPKGDGKTVLCVLTVVVDE